jgi:hypothetical protein
VGVGLVFALLSRARAEVSSACPTLAGICCHGQVRASAGASVQLQVQVQVQRSITTTTTTTPTTGRRHPRIASHASTPLPPIAHRQSPISIDLVAQWRAGTLRKASRGPSTHSVAARGHHAHAQHDAACNPRRRAIFPLPP